MPKLSFWSNGQYDLIPVQNSTAQDIGFNPLWQIEQYKAGHKILISFEVPLPQKKWERRKPYYEAAFIYLYQNNLPFCLISQQYEDLLQSAEFVQMPYETSPFAFEDGALKQVGVSYKLDVMGNNELAWYEIGKRFGEQPLLQWLQTLYPEPPIVKFISNNEAPYIRWKEFVTSDRFRDMPAGLTDLQKRQLEQQGLKDRQQAMINGIRDSLIAWESVTFGAYDLRIPQGIGRGNNWYAHNYIPPNFAWNIASEPYYLNPWSAERDDLAASPQINLMNIPFQLEGQFWEFELSIWDGQPKNKAGDAWTTERYAAWALLGIWLTRPKTIREYRNSDDTREDYEAYTLALQKAIDNLNGSEMGKWYRTAKLIPHSSEKHPYSANLDDYKDEPRWFLMDCDANPPREIWSKDLREVKLKAFPIAFQETVNILGDSPRIMVYTYVPEPPLECTINVRDRSFAVHFDNYDNYTII